MVSSPFLRCRVAALELVPRCGQGAGAGSDGMGVSIAVSSIHGRVSIRARRPALEPRRAWVWRPLACEWLWAWDCEHPAEPAWACVSHGLSTSAARADGECRGPNRVGGSPSRAGIGAACVTGAAQRAHEADEARAFTCRLARLGDERGPFIESRFAAYAVFGADEQREREKKYPGMGAVTSSSYRREATGADVGSRCGACTREYCGTPALLLAIGRIGRSFERDLADMVDALRRVGNRRP